MGEAMDWIGTATLTVAAATLLVVIWQELRHFLLRRDANLVVSTIDFAGIQKLRVTNLGDVPARGVRVMARDFTGKKNRSEWDYPVLDAGEVKLEEVQGINGDSWVQFWWRSPHHRDRVILTWSPAQKQSPLMKELYRQKMLSWREARIARIRFGAAVGPGKQMTALMPGSPRKLSKKLKKIEQKTAKISAKQSH